MELKKEWKPSPGRFANGEDLWIGKVKVGSYFYKSGSRGDPTKYRAAIELPTINMRDDTIDWPTIEEAKARVERAVDTWFKWLEG